VRTGDDDEYRMVMAAAEAAKLAERERCAKIADSFAYCTCSDRKDEQPGEGHYDMDCEAGTAERIALEIRGAE